MKIIALILAVILVAHLLIPVTCLAQQGEQGYIVQLQEQIAKLEKADLDPDLSPEVRAFNRQFLLERRRELNALTTGRVAALRRYLTTMEGVLKPEERQVIENSIRKLSGELRSDEPESVADSVAIVKASLNTSANDVVRWRVNSDNQFGYTEASTSRVVSVPKPSGYYDAPLALPNLLPQDRHLATSGEELVINTPVTEIPKPKEVDNGSVVTVGGTKSFVNTCVVATKREEVKPEPNPLGQMIKVLIGLGPVPLGKIASPSCSTGPATGISVPTDPEASRIEADLAALQRRLTGAVGDVNKASKDFSLSADKVAAFTNCKEIRLDASGDPDLDNSGKYKFDEICDSAANFDAAKGRIKQAVETTLGKPFPIMESTEVQIAALRNALTEGYKKKGEVSEPSEPNWIADVSSRLDCYAGTLEAVRKEHASLQSSRADFENFLKLLSRHTTDGFYKKELIVDSNAKVSGTVTCTNYFTKQPAFDPIPFTVTYQAFSRHAVSAGILFTTLNKRQIGINPVRTGTAADGTPTFKLTFTETDRADGQLVPFTFYNYRLWGGRKFNLNGSGGVGLNFNNGTSQAEFFFGGALGFKNVFMQFGGHVGRWQELGGGFVIGDVVPAVIPVPIERRYSIRPSIGVSYKLPLP